MTTETSLCVSPIPLSRMPPAGGLGDRELDLLVGQHPPGAAGTGVVAGLDQHAVDVDAVGVGPADDPAARPGAMWAIIRDVVVLPLVPVTATTGTRGAIVVGAAPGSLAATVGARAAATSPRRSPRPAGRRRQRVEHRGDGSAHGPGPLAVPPRVGDDDLVRVAGGSHPHRQRGRPRLAGRPRGPGARRRAPRTAAGSRCPARPGGRRPGRCARPGRSPPSPARGQGVMSRVSLTAARGK